MADRPIKVEIKLIGEQAAELVEVEVVHGTEEENRQHQQFHEQHMALYDQQAQQMQQQQPQEMIQQEPSAHIMPYPLSEYYDQQGNFDQERFDQDYPNGFQEGQSFQLSQPQDQFQQFPPQTSFEQQGQVEDFQNSNEEQEMTHDLLTQQYDYSQQGQSQGQVEVQNQQTGEVICLSQEEYQRLQQQLQQPQSCEQPQSQLSGDVFEVEHIGGGWYDLPTGERVRGKRNAEIRMEEVMANPQAYGLRPPQTREEAVQSANAYPVNQFHQRVEQQAQEYMQQGSPEQFRVQDDQGQGQGGFQGGNQSKGGNQSQSGGNNQGGQSQGQGGNNRGGGSGTQNQGGNQSQGGQSQGGNQGGNNGGGNRIQGGNGRGANGQFVSGNSGNQSQGGNQGGQGGSSQGQGNRGGSQGGGNQGGSQGQGGRGGNQGGGNSGGGNSGGGNSGGR